MRISPFTPVALLALIFCATVPLTSQTETDAWLHYSRLSAPAANSDRVLPTRVDAVGDSVILKTAQQELVKGFAQVLGRTLRPSSSPLDAIVLAKFTDLHVLVPNLHLPPNLPPDGYWLKRTKIHGHNSLFIASPTDRGVLYGVFALLSKIARGENIRRPRRNAAALRTHPLGEPVGQSRRPH